MRSASSSTHGHGSTHPRLLIMHAAVQAARARFGEVMAAGRPHAALQGCVRFRSTQLPARILDVQTPCRAGAALPEAPTHLCTPCHTFTASHTHIALAAADATIAAAHSSVFV